MKVSKKSLWLIITSFLVSAALIVTVVLYAVNVNRRGVMQSAEMWFVAAIVVLAALTFGLFTWQRLYKSRYVKKLNEKYYAAYEKIGDALQSAKMSKAELREAKLDILSLMLEAQENGRDVSEIVGDDTAEYVENLQRSFGYRSSFLFELLSVLQYGVFFVTFIQALIYFTELGRVPFFESETSLSLFCMFVITIFVLYPLLRRAMRKDKTAAAMITPLIFGVAFIVLIIVLDNTLGHLSWVRFFLDTKIVMISTLWQLIVMAAVAVIAQFVKWMMRRRSIEKLKQ